MLGKWVVLNVRDFGEKTVEEFTKAISEEFMGVHALTLLKGMIQVFRKKDGYIVETASDNTLTVLKVEKGAGKKVEGVQILQMENTKYSVSDLHFLNEHVLEYGEKEDIEMKIDKVRNLIETLTTGLVKLNTNDFVAQGVCRGKRINDGGGCYFVEQKNVATFERYVSELESFLGIDYVSYCRGAINRDADGVFTVAAAVRLNVLSRMEDGLAKLKKYKTDRGVQNRYEEVAELMDEVQMYEDMLGVTFDDLKAELTDARLEITSHLSF